MAGLKPMRTEFGIHQRLESCASSDPCIFWIDINRKWVMWPTKPLQACIRNWDFENGNYKSWKLKQDACNYVNDRHLKWGCREFHQWCPTANCQSYKISGVVADENLTAVPACFFWEFEAIVWWSYIQVCYAFEYALFLAYTCCLTHIAENIFPASKNNTPSMNGCTIKYISRTGKCKEYQCNHHIGMDLATLNGFNFGKGF